MSKGFIVHGPGHAMTVTGKELCCPHGCRYCFARTEAHKRLLDQDPNGFEPSEFKERFASIAEKMSKHFLIYTSRYHDPLAGDAEIGLAILNELAEQRRSIAVLTKSAPSDRIIAELVAINTRLQAHGKHLVLEESFTSGIDKRNIEPRVPSVARRIAFIQKMIEKGMLVAGMISPLLPRCIVPDDEATALIPLAVKAGMRAFTVDPGLHFTPDMAANMHFPYNDPVHTGSIRQMTRSRHGTVPPGEWMTYHDPDQSKTIIAAFEDAGIRVFPTSIRTIRHLLSNKEQMPIAA